MPTRTWVVGEEVLAADFNTFVQQQVVSTFANTAARDAWSSAPNGARCVTLDTGTKWERRGGAWRRDSPGVVLRDWPTGAVESGDIGTSAVPVRAGNVDFEAGRTYMVTGTITIITRTAGTLVAINQLAIGGVALNSTQSPPGLGANIAYPLHVHHHYLAATTGPAQVVLNLFAVSGSVPVRFLTATGYPNGLTVIDQGPA